MKVYKCVSKDIEGKLISAFFNQYYILTLEQKEIINKYSLTYIPNVKTLPVKGKIFAFRTLKDAKLFNIGNEIWLADASISRIKIKFVYSDICYITGNFDCFWDNRKNGNSCLPTGSIFCNSLTLLEKVCDI